MTDNRTTELTVTDRLRELLDERGVEYETDERNAITKWSTYYGAFVFFARQREGKLLVETTVATKHSVILTPEQAIAATLGSGTCRNQWQWNSGFCCSECFYTVPFVDKFANSPFAYCPNCGKEVAQ